MSTASDLTKVATTTTSESESELESDSTIVLILRALLQAIIAVTIIFSNTLVVVAIRRFSSLQTITNYFVTSLAVADLMIGFLLPLNILLVAVPDWNLDHRVCVCRIVMVLLPCSGSINSLLLVAIDRHQAIVFPFYYLQHMTPNRVRYILVGSWVFSLLTTTIPIYYNTYTVTGKPLDICNFHTLLNISSVWMYFIYFGTVVGIMLVLYGHIFLTALRQLRRIHSVEQSTSTTTASATSPTLNFFRETRTTKTLSIVMGAFLLSWLPFQLVEVLMSIGLEGQALDVIYQISIPILMANSCMNPAIYAWRNSDFRAAFRQLLSRNRYQPKFERDNHTNEQ